MVSASRPQSYRKSLLVCASHPSHLQPGACWSNRVDNLQAAGATAATTVSITDDDPQVTVSFGAATYTAEEGGTATVTVTLSADPERTVEVPITTTNQGGASSADYSGVPASVTFDAGDTSKTFDFAATADTADDDGESVELGFGTSLPAGVSAGLTVEAPAPPPSGSRREAQ